jgi:hypothetical protein
VKDLGAVLAKPPGRDCILAASTVSTVKLKLWPGTTPHRMSWETRVECVHAMGRWDGSQKRDPPVMMPVQVG